MNDQMVSSLVAANLVARIPARQISWLGLQVTKIVGQALVLVIFGALAMLEPFVRFVLMSLAILGMFVTIVFGFLIAADGFPKWTMLEMSVGCFLLLATYYTVMHAFRNIGTMLSR